MKKKKFLDVLDEVVIKSESGAYTTEASDGSVLLLTKRSGSKSTRITAVCSNADATLMLYALGYSEPFKSHLATAVAMLFQTDKEFSEKVETLLADDGKILKELVAEIAERDYEQEEQADKPKETKAEDGRIAFTLPFKKKIAS